MIKLRYARACLTAATSLLAATTALGAATTHTRFSGKTSQRRPISFEVVNGSVTMLRYRIDDVCPGRRHLFVRAWGFPPLAIKNGQFGGKFVAKPPNKASATVRGHISGDTVRGTLSDRTENRRNGKICTGHATFTLIHP